MLKFIFFIILNTLLFSSQYSAQEAHNHIGEEATVCGVVVSSHYAKSSKGEPTFLNLDVAYPEHIFTVLIWGEDREQFKKPEIRYKNQKICVQGEISSYKGIPQIILYSKKQLNP
jgi:DNA/RNA endonuclease YhcR with UshA esterase domain